MYVRVSRNTSTYVFRVQVPTLRSQRLLTSGCSLSGVGSVMKLYIHLKPWRLLRLSLPVTLGTPYYIAYAISDISDIPRPFVAL